MTCLFCDPAIYQDWVVHETENFFVKIGLGLVAAGQVMIITKRHLACLADIPLEQEEEYLQLKRLIYDRTEQLFSKPFFMEYGVFGQSVNHAHVHAIPSKGHGYHVKSLVKEMVDPGRIQYVKTDREGLRRIFKERGGYISIEEDGELYAMLIDAKTHTWQNPNPYLGYRPFFASKGVKGVQNWHRLTPEEVLIDKGKREETRRVWLSRLCR